MTEEPTAPVEQPERKAATGQPPAGPPTPPAIWPTPPAGPPTPPAEEPAPPTDQPTPPPGPPAPPKIDPSRYLQYLPAIYHENDFLGHFLHIPEDIVEPVEDVLDEISHCFDPRMAPASFLPWLASWIDLALDENWPEERRRELIHQGTELYRWRGTRRGLITYLRIYAGVEPEIVEHLTAKDGGPFRFTVVLKVKDAAAVNEARVRSIIEAEKPAHTNYTLRIEAPGSKKEA